jgi:ubiquinone/menaquinone biosynthesis C-methylase UbiE
MNKGSPEVENKNPVRRFYDVVAPEYAEKYFHEFDHKPFDRSILERFAGLTRSKGRVCDAGCGPGEVARFLKDLAVDACGLDVSERMLEEARRLSPDIEFNQGDMLHLYLPDETLAGIAAFYAIVHFSENQVRTAFREFHRVLSPGGALLIAFHAGNETLHIEEAFGRKAGVDFVFFNPDFIQEALIGAGFTIDETHLRDPYPEVEYPSRRAYLWASKPGSSSKGAGR